MGRSWPSLAADKREATKVFRRRKSTARILLSAFFIPLGIGFGGMSLLLIGLRIMPLPEGGSAMPTEIESADGTRIANWTTTAKRRRMFRWITSRSLWSQRRSPSKIKTSIAITRSA
ncbi:hypothetical protein GCM10025858_20050 [Alicyclobacillus sacchari]|uniref:hypothetical protein n=1 Tax=Alicyclobacillus sacchari TaxID=392010 RepID=UPI0023E91EDA|nr:hypothetical protein [Alicyclobacillus sacchari]GMA57502.1 hypothetical protein GCM10025858_20050 [Alicyclobacillus sacchari]